MYQSVPFAKAASPNLSNPAYNAETHVTTAGADRGEDVLVHKLADEVIPFIRQQSYMRQFFRTIDMPTLQFNVPKINVGSEVFFVVEANPSPYTSVQTGSVILVAKKLMTAMTISSELANDNVVPILPHIKRDLAKAFALAEEELYLYGNENPQIAISGSTHWGLIRTEGGNFYPRNKYSGASPGSVTEFRQSSATNGAATESCWFVNDKRRAFDGLSVLAEPGFSSTTSPGTPATKVDAGGRAISIDDVNDAIENLDVFGRDKGQLLLLVSLREEKSLRADPTILTTLERFGPSTVFLTGEIGKVYGISCVATNLIPTTMGSIWTRNNTTAANGEDKDEVLTNDRERFSEAFVVNRNAILLGDRRQFSLRASDIPFMTADQLLLVANERIAMAAQYRPALCKIENLRTS